MVQSVEKYPLEDTATHKESISSSSYNPNAVQDRLFARLTNAFPESVDLAEHKEALIWASFGLFNLLLATAICQLPYFNQIYTKLNSFVAILFALLTFPIGYFALNNTFIKAYEDIRKKSLSVNVCLSIATVLGMFGLVYMLLADRGALISLPVDRFLLSYIFVITVANYTEAWLSQRILDKCGINLSRLCPQVSRMNLEAQGVFETVEISKIKVGDIISVNAGDMIAFDGEVIDGQAQVMEAFHSFKKHPRQKQFADKVYCGSKISNGNLVYKVTALESEAVSADFINAVNGKFIIESDKEVQKFNLNQVICNMLLIATAVAAGLYWQAGYQNINAAVSVSMGILSIGLISKILYLQLGLPVFLEGAAFMHGILAVKKPLESILNGVKRYVIDFNSELDAKSSVHLKKLELVDKRLDENSLPSLLFCLAARGEGNEATAIAEFINEQKSGINVFQVQDFVEYPGRGFCGKILGSEFSIGNEDFLLERGVLLQPSDIGEDDPEEGYFWFVALEGDVIAYLHFLELPSQDIANQIELLRKQNLRLTICSTQDSKLVDSAAQALGFELADIYGGLSEENYSKKLESIRPFAMLSSSETSKSLRSKSEVSLSEFNEVLYDLNQADVILFGDRLKAFSKALLMPALANKIGRQNLYTAIALSALLFTLCLLNLVSPAVILFAVLCASLGMQLNILRLEM